jgi:deazaflavin-dependent oxidoreductase (nitroreductase family)
MPIEGEYEPATWDLAANQVERYEASGGTQGTRAGGTECIVLWTCGRKTGKVRKSPLMRVTDGVRYAAVASMGGQPANPSWYGNLVADPHVTVQDGPVVRDFTARVVEGEEKAAWWRRATEVWPAYDQYQAKTEREIPLVVLEPRIES